MIIITGQPRCGTSMMTRCIHLAGVPLAFTNNIAEKRKEEMKKKFRNIYGFFEGKWDGTDGVIKRLHPKKWDEFPNPRFIYMQRHPDKIKKSWEAIHAQGRETPIKPDPERLAELRKNALAMRGKIKNKVKKTPRVKPVSEEILKYPHIKVDYDKFVTDTESYRKDFEELFPELDFDLIKSGVDKSLYINR